jgi:hypothetical protein
MKKLSGVVTHLVNPLTEDDKIDVHFWKVWQITVLMVG